MSNYNVLVTGGAGFIGSNLVEKLLSLENVKKVRVLDNLSTGKMENIQEFDSNPKFEFLKGDIRDFDTCIKACQEIQVITHQAALGSVPRSINDPVTTNAVNISGTLNIFTAAKELGIKRVVYAASSSTYGDSPSLPKVEDKIGNPLSPYAITKYVNELYADVFAKLYGMEIIGLRYFNVFGPKQNPKGAYAAVIPLFMQAVIDDQPPKINGDGEQSRDFTFVENAVQANLKALFTENSEAVNQVYNVACGERTTLNELFQFIVEVAEKKDIKPVYGPSRQGDVKHSLADVSKGDKLLGYQPEVMIKEGLKKAFQWYKNQ
ncbi:MAG: SDR family oxidoreductase [Flammeovirgaceae bacterium]|nr:SDR family oxidoreductase [Flammeovirgaceae bacterium]